METGRKHPNYIAVWGGLAALTVIEVAVAYLRIERHLLVLTLLLLAVWKVLLVALYFMHLRFEPKRLALIAMTPLPLGVLLVVAVLQEFAGR
ncbi:MAG: cytochrome C oxidase subunit IV family protein [Gemmatimonadota bacterium]